jgi:hypothetical protein
MLRFISLPLAAAVLLAACNASNVGNLPTSASANEALRNQTGREYLYVADQDVYQSRERQLIQRFLLSDGIPQKSPGFTIYPSSGFTPGDLVSVDGTGNVYSLTSGGDGPVYVFAADKKVPKYSLDLPNPAACTGDPSNAIQVSAMTTDSQGHVFVNFATWAVGAKTKRPVPAVGKNGTICSGIWVFAPGARGNQTPIVTIPLERIRAATELAVDGSGNLYAAISGTHVAEYANAATKPVRTRLFYSPHRTVGAVATDETGNVFIVTSIGYSSPRINRYSATGNPHDGPINSFEPATGGFLATLARHVFVTNGETLNVYHAYENGPQQPLFAFNSHEIYTMAVGP